MAIPNPLNILVIEGPAGSGKNFIIHTLCQYARGEFDYPEKYVDFSRPRDYGQWDDTNGGALACLKDYGSIIGITQAWKKASQPKIYVVDRFIWSSFVYGSIRTRQNQELALRRGINLAFETVHPIITDFLSRSSQPLVGEEKPVPPRVNLVTMWNIPTCDDLQYRRQQNLGKKKYPFTCQQEIKHYERLYDVAQQAGYFKNYIYRGNITHDIQDVADNIYSMFDGKEL